MKDTRFVTALMMPALVALEAAQWSFAKARSPSSKMALALESAQECCALATISENGTTAAIERARANKLTSQPACPLLFRIVLRPLVLDVVLFLAPLIAPLPIEEYIAYHFSKGRLFCVVVFVGGEHCLFVFVLMCVCGHCTVFNGVCVSWRADACYHCRLRGLAEPDQQGHSLPHSLFLLSAHFISFVCLCRLLVVLMRRRRCAICRPSC